ncbi:MAG: WD40 repeat domain-containing protein, partial [Chloroflexi bacterium]|nr:WD40 repeat domain-containing protein [Chloroflexota bacterium]
FGEGDETEPALVNVGVFTPDGQFALTGGNDGFVRVWDVNTGDEIDQLEIKIDEDSEKNPRDLWVNALAISPDSTDSAALTILTAREDGMVDLWNLGTGDHLRRFDAEAPVGSVAFSPDGQLIFASTAAAEIIVWDVNTGEQRYRLSNHIGVVLVAQFTPDGRYIVSSSEDGTVRLWDLENGGQQIRELNNGLTISDMALTPDGTQVLTAADDTTVRLWDIAPITLDELKSWTADNRVPATLTPKQIQQYGIRTPENGEGSAEEPVEEVVEETADTGS